MERRQAILIAGPTASGKSRLAIELAQKHDGVIVNADSMQVYAELLILTARPSAEEEAAVPHRLFGHVPASEHYSVGHWIEDVGKVLGEINAAGRFPIIAGGSGLYFKALTEGLAPVPRAPRVIRQSLVRRLDEEGPEKLHAELKAFDPIGAEAINPNDSSRVLRALEVIESTGKPLWHWQKEPGVLPLIDPERATRIVLEPDRSELGRRIDERVDRMIGEGAIEEARAFGTLHLDPSLPATKAIGIRELLDHLAGGSSLNEAVARMKTETRRYAKRQTTWFRNQMKDWERVHPAKVAPG